MLLQRSPARALESNRLQRATHGRGHLASAPNWSAFSPLDQPIAFTSMPVYASRAGAANVPQKYVLPLTEHVAKSS